MKREILALFLVTIIFSVSGEKGFNTTSSLYKVYKEGYADTSYVFGTIHLVPKDQFVVSDLLMDKFNDCNTLLMELDLNMSLKDQMTIMQNAILPEGKSIADYMKPADFNTFNSYLIDSLGLKEKKLERYYRFEPFFIQSFIYNDYYKKIESYEQFFNKKAGKKNMNIKGLETWEFQFSLVDSMGIEAQLELLSTDFISEYEQLLEHYLKNDFKAVEEILAAEMDSEFEEQFLKRRNETWIPLLLEYFNEGDIFVAIGAAHILGNNGILKRLEEEGFIVEAVKLDN